MCLSKFIDKEERTMSLEKCITSLLNVKLDDIETLDELDKADGSVDVLIKLKRKDLSCPLCNGECKVHGYYKRKLIHSTLVNRKCTIIYAQRRYKCQRCDYTFHEDNPFGHKKENVTYETKVNVLKDLKYPNFTYTSTARRYNLSITKVQRIFDNHVDIKRKSLPEVLSIDEHYFPESSYDSLYMCILMDFNDGTIIDVLPDRKKNYLVSYFSNIKNNTLDDKTHISELNNVKYVSIDLWDTYKDIAVTYFPKAIICADSFHVLEHLTKDFSKVRIKCRNQTENKDLQYLLTKFMYIFNNGVNLDNKPKNNKRLKRYLNYRDIINILFDRFPELKLAYDLKEEYIYFNQTANIENAADKLSELIIKFSESGIEEYVEFYNLLVNWYKEIINSFTIYHNRRINNSYIESRNRDIEKLIFNANGFTNFKRTRNRILYCLNKEDTYKI